MKEISATEYTRVQAGPMDLEAGRFALRQATDLAVITLCALFIGALGGMIARVSVGWQEYAPEYVKAFRAWSAILGGSIALFAYGFAGAVGWLVWRGWRAHQDRVEAWSKAQLEAYKATGGSEHTRTLSVKTLSVSEPLHVVAVALHVVDRARSGAAEPWSSVQLRGPIWYGKLRLGDLTKGDAEAFSRALADCGLVRGRRKGYAGELFTTDIGEALDMVRIRYGRIKPGRIEATNGAEAETLDGGL